MLQTMLSNDKKPNIEVDSKLQINKKKLRSFFPILLSMLFFILKKYLSITVIINIWSE